MEGNDSLAFKQKLYEQFASSGMIAKLQTELRTNLLERLQKPNSDQQAIVEEHDTPFHLRHKFLESIIMDHLTVTKKEYALSIYRTECNLDVEDCLKYSELAEIAYLGGAAYGRSFLSRLLEEYVRRTCSGVAERSSQTDFSEPLSKKLEDIDSVFKSKIDYWKLVPQTSVSNPSKECFDLQQRLEMQFKVEKQQLRKELQGEIKKQMESKFENQYLFRMREVQKQHETRLTELKNRQKSLLESLERKKGALDEKAGRLNDQELKMINKYQVKLAELEHQFRKRTLELEGKEKEFWKKELELKAKKREYQDTIRLVKQKVIDQASI